MNARRRNKCVPKLRLSWWKESKTGWSAHRNDVFEEIKRNGHSFEEIRRRMGAGIHLLNELIDGQELDLWSAYFVDGAIGPRQVLDPLSSSQPGGDYGVDVENEK